MQRFEDVVEVDAPVEHVFDLFSDFESFPRWMAGLRAVRRRGRRLTHWVAETALDIDVEWDAETTVFEPDRRVVWRSVGGDVRADGEAVFDVTPRGTTLVRLVLGYGTPGGRTGERVARFFGRHPGRQLTEDLRRFRRLAERHADGERRGDARERGRRPEHFARGESAAERARLSDSRLREEQRRQIDGEDAHPFAGRRPEEHARHESGRHAALVPLYARGQGELGGRPRRSRDEEFGPRRERPERERPRHAMTPRERERERRHEHDRQAEEDDMRRAGWFLRRGVDRLMEEPPRRNRRS